LKERRKERQQQSPGFSLIDLQANYVNAQKILMLIVVPYLSPYLICILMPRDWFPTSKKKTKTKSKRKREKKAPRTTRRYQIGSFVLYRSAHFSFD
jgi:hypothetical protein